MENNWEIVSKRLTKEDIRFANILFEGLLDGEESYKKEREHWWIFLSTFTELPLDIFKEKIIHIHNKNIHSLEKEIEYDELLQIGKPLDMHIVGKELKGQIEGMFDGFNPPTTYTTPAWIFRWYYTYSDESGEIVKDPGLTLKTFNRYLKEGKIEPDKVKKLFKRATFIKKVRSGCPDKWSSDLIEVSKDELGKI